MSAPTHNLPSALRKPQTFVSRFVTAYVAEVQTRYPDADPEAILLHLMHRGLEAVGYLPRPPGAAQPGQ
jgi:hypothetical protein